MGVRQSQIQANDVHNHPTSAPRHRRQSNIDNDNGDDQGIVRNIMNLRFEDPNRTSSSTRQSLSNSLSTSFPSTSSSHRHSSSDGTNRTPLISRIVRNGTNDGSSTQNAQLLSFLHIMGNKDSKCPICNKMIPSDDVEMHFVMCLTKPVISYNEDVLTIYKGECAICLEDMDEGDTIARLPCLCIYHKLCIDEWFKRRNICPEHPGE